MRKLVATAALASAGALGFLIPAGAASAQTTDSQLAAQATTVWAHQAGLPACPGGVTYYAGRGLFGTLCAEAIDVTDVVENGSTVTFNVTEGYLVTVHPVGYNSYSVFYSGGPATLTLPAS